MGRSTAATEWFIGRSAQGTVHRLREQVYIVYEPEEADRTDFTGCLTG
jgi:hypothetical protein